MHYVETALVNVKESITCRSNHIGIIVNWIILEIEFLITVLHIVHDCLPGFKLTQEEQAYNRK
jgi:hypothetical protein